MNNVQLRPQTAYDVTGASLNYRYSLAGTVTNVYEKDGAGTMTGRQALFSYAFTNGIARLATMTDMGGYTTSFEYGSQPLVLESSVVTSDYHVVAFTWPNGGRWGFDLRQTYFYGYREPLRLTVTDPVGHETVYDSYSFSERGPVGKRDRNGASWLSGLDTVGDTTYGKYTTLVNDRPGRFSYNRQGEYVDYREFSYSGKWEPLFARQLLDPVTGAVGLSQGSLEGRTDTANAPRKDVWYAYQAFTNGHRVVTVSNAVYRAVAGQADAQFYDQWTETLEQNGSKDKVS